MAASLAINCSVVGVAVIVNQSTDGGLTWSNPVVVHAATGSEFLDKDWIVCDDTSTSPSYGHCYAEWDDNGHGNLIHMSTSTNGGNTWGAQQTTANNATGIGGQPLVQPNGTVIVPIDNANETSVLAFTSTNGGSSWSSTVTVATISSHTDAGARTRGGGDLSPVMPSERPSAHLGGNRRRRQNAPGAPGRDGDARTLC